MSIPTPRKVNGIPMGRGISKAPFFKESMALKWNFQRG